MFSVFPSGHGTDHDFACCAQALVLSGVIFADGVMLWLALLTVGLTSSGMAAEASGEPVVYRPPAVQPYQPYSDFGREVVEGDGEADLRRRPVLTPTTIETYAGAYEVAPSADDVAYAAGVAKAGAAADALMGPLDGAWSVIDSRGRQRLSLVLGDTGHEPIEGAFTRSQERRASVAGYVSGVRQADGAIRLTGTEPGWTLVLHRDGADWRGRLSGPEGSAAVVLRRAG